MCTNWVVCRAFSFDRSEEVKWSEVHFSSLLMCFRQSFNVRSVRLWRRTGVLACCVAGSNCLHWHGACGTHHADSSRLGTYSSARRYSKNTQVVKRVIDSCSFHCKSGIVGILLIYDHHFMRTCPCICQDTWNGLQLMTYAVNFSQTYVLSRLFGRSCSCVSVSDCCCPIWAWEHCTVE